MDKAQQKTWKDRVPPDGHLPASYEVQVCDEGNKVIAVQMLDKSGIDYKISARKGQFYIQAADMQTFTKIKGVLNQSLDMNKEADKMGFKPEMPTDITPVSTNTPQADITASNVAVTEPVKEDIVSEVKVNDTVKLLDYVQKNGKEGINTYARVTKVNSDGSIEVTNMNMPFQGTLAHAKIAKDKFLKEGTILGEGLDFNLEQMSALLDKAEKLVAKMKKHLTSDVTVATFRKTMNELLSVVHTEIPKTLKSKPKALADKEAADKKNRASKVDPTLSKLWQEYFEQNYAWDDGYNHDGVGWKKAKAKCEKIEATVTKNYSSAMAKKMVKWAQDAYEQNYYNRGKKWDKLIKELPVEVDPTWIEEEYL